MTHKYNFVSITPVFKIRRFLLFLILVSLGSSSIIYAADPIQTIQKATGVSKTAAEISPGSDPVVTLSSTSIGLFATNSIQEVVQVTSNTTWTVNSDLPSWLTVNPNPGRGNGTLTFTAVDNNSGIERNASVTVSSTGLDDQIIVVTQMPDIPSITFTSSASTKLLSVQLQFKSTGTVYIDWGDGDRKSYAATTSMLTYSTPLDLTGMPVKIYGMEITNIILTSNYLTTLVVSQCTDLSSLDISRNYLSEMDITKNTRLTFLDASSNNLNKLDVRNNAGLKILSCFSNKIDSLDVSKNIALSKLYCYSNMLTSLDVSKNTLLTLLYCYSNKLKFTTLPQIKKTGYLSYKYAPQAKLHVIATINKIDLSSQISAMDVDNNFQTTVYKWYTRSGGLLVPGTDYTDAGGVFTFLKTFPDSVYCDMTNKAFPKFVDPDFLRTENIKMILEKPIVTTLSVSNIKPTTATGSGSIDKLGVPDPTAKGVCLNLSGMPTIADNVIYGSGSAFIPGNFTADITGLSPYTTYHIRAFATNLVDTGYGADSTFTTKGLPPIVTTNPATNIGITTVTLNGSIVDLGAPNPSQHGFVWDTADNPILEISTYKNLGLTSQTGTFLFNVTGLKANTLYYYRAYAINNVDTVYGEKLSVETTVPAITIPDPTDLRGLTSMFGLPSASQIFSIGGILTDDLIITAPDGFEVRENGTGKFVKADTIKSVSEILTLKQIEVRISPTAPLGAVSGIVVCSSTGATPQFVSVEGIVSPAKLTVSELEITSKKEYDGNTKAEVIKVTLSGVAIIDEGNVIITATASYDDASLGNGKTITVKYTISGSAIDKYVVPIDSVITTGEITKKQLITMDWINPIREYDGTRTVIVPPGPLMGVVDAEIADVQLETIALYNDSTINSGKTITVTYSLSGLKADNYLAPVNYVIPNCEITRKQLFVSLTDTTALTKVKDYDGTSVAGVITAGSLVGVLATDDGKVILEATASYDNASSGWDKEITVTYTLTGSEAYKYFPPFPLIFPDGMIKGKPLEISEPKVTFKKNYDREKTAFVDFGVIISGVDPGDEVVLGAIATYDDANFGTGKTITLIYTLTNAAGDSVPTYTVPRKVVYTNGEIDKISLTATPATMTLSKVYTSTTRAYGELGDFDGLIGADTLTVVPVLEASYDNANVGNDKTIKVSYNLTGENSGNYIPPLSYTIGGGIITPAALIVTAVNDTIIYNGTINSKGKPKTVGKGSNDIISTYPIQVYDNANVGYVHVMTASGLVIKNGAGQDASLNYDISYNHSVLPGIIKPKLLTASDPILAVDKEYDGKSEAKVTSGNLLNVESGDIGNVVLKSSASYDNANSGKGKSITVKYTIEGTASGNYTAPVDSVTTGVIDKKALTSTDPTITLEKEYNGNKEVTVEPGNLSGIVDADIANVVLVPIATYNDATIGTGKTITVTYTLNGSAAGNYTAPATFIVTNGVIKGKILTVANQAVPAQKDYDGNITVSNVIPGTLTGVDLGDDIMLHVTAIYDNATVGTGKTITVIYTLTGLSKDIYSVPDDYVINSGEIKPKQLTAEAPNVITLKEYDGKLLASVTPGNLSGFEVADQANLLLTAVASYDNVNAGNNKSITVKYTIEGSASGNYTAPVDYTVATGVIVPKPLTASDPMITLEKEYNGNKEATVLPGTLSVVEDADLANVGLVPIATYDDAAVGTGKKITVTYTLNGSAAGNYNPPSDFIVTNGVIKGKILTVTDQAVPAQKEYDGNTTVSNVIPGTLTGVDPGDDVVLNATATYDNATVGTDKTITVIYTLTGLSRDIYSAPDDYVINSGEIKPKLLTVEAPTITTVKEYDGKLLASVTPGILSGFEVSDQANILLTAAASYDNVNAGKDKSITVTYTIEGSASGNYTAPVDYTVTTGEIVPKPLTSTDPTITLEKEYNGNKDATVVPGILSVVEDADLANVGLVPIATYDDATVGTGKTITVTYTLNGSAAGNYTAPATFIVTNGVIKGKALNVTDQAVHAQKEYDGNTTVSNVIPGTLTGVDPGDDVVLNATATYDNATVGTDKTITVKYTLTGLSKAIYAVPDNYIINSGEIKPKQLTVDIPLSTPKTYDGTTQANVITGTLSGVVTTDIGNVDFIPTANYDNANKGINKTILVSYALTGTSAGNYTAPADYTLTNGEITVKPLAVIDEIINDVKVYDGNSEAKVIKGTLSGIEIIDEANAIYTTIATYDNVNVGKSKIITVTYTLTGSAAGNYTVPSDFTILTGAIEPKPLTSSDPIIMAKKVYNGDLVAEVIVGTLSGVEAVDVANVVLKATALYDDMTVGSGKTITVSYILTGSAASNYTAPSDYIILTGEISGMPLTITPPTVTILKVYNGTPLANVIAGSLSGIQTGDDVTVIATATYDNATVGTGKTITVTYTLGGPNAAIYAVPSNDVITNGQIDPKSLTANNTALTVSKIYDGNSTAGVTPGTLNGVETGDDVILIATATYDNAIEGTGKTISVVYTLTGASAGNYSAPSNYSVSNGEITVKPLIPLNMTVTLIKTYDGSNSVTVIPGVLTGVESGDDVTLNVVATYDNANAGTGKTITVTFSLSGTAAANYIAPANYSISSGVINPNTLSASKPLIATIKEYDGSSSVEFAQGILVGVDPLDVPNVTLTATASYENATAGIGKTITITYGLIGLQAGNYVAPPDYVITTGIITPKPLVVVSLKITNSKLYDGTTPATFTVGDLTGVMPTDAGNVILSGEAMYDNANAGSGKNITVTFSLSGLAAGNYKTPSSYTITNGVILARQLTISDPVIVLNKMVDGNTTAVITTPGTMQGVEATDADKVSITAAANYDNQNVGINKKITVVYTLGGSAMDNYIAPVDFIVTGAKISDNVILSPIVTPTNGCEGSSLDLAYDVLTGTPTQYRITFDATTLAAGIQNVSYTDLPSTSASGILSISIPAGTIDGNYQGTLQFRNELGIESPVYTFLFTINVSKDYIISKFDDVVLIDNSSNRFVAYQWYKDGVELKGATKQFYNDLGGLVGSYTVKLTTVDGQTLYTCPKVLEISLAKKVSVFPSPVKKYQLTTIKLTGVGDDELVGAELSVYTMQGTRVYHSTQVEKVNSISLPPIAGMYVGRVTTSKGQELQFKVIVIE